ncbi:hypothetical protein LQV63_04285 [Paenibacillus profundus]|uniref:Viral coat protein P2 N-terminal domain-containing protein n=1 Tax=Paenibacillus profundus TaxID=1173085 RepID=A0ABS8YEP9_9BACL|nr:hypothetical protein [Paenibacillus profundus]MCE5168532.1 hypothetical protein [Paenibacillus profundus]
MSESYGRVTELIVGGQTLKTPDLEIHFDVPFDDDPDPNEARIEIYNLSDNTVNNITHHSKVVLNAGYKGDVGTILSGYISFYETRWDGPDKITTFSVLDSEPLDERTIPSVSYAKNTKASTIIKDLLKRGKLSVAVMSLVKDVVYTEGMTVEGSVVDAIKNVAADCQTSFYILQGKLYIRPLSQGDRTNFVLSPKTGLLGSPSFFSDDSSAGYQAQCLLNHRLTTGSLITLESRVVEASLRVRRGRHSSSGTDFTTDVEAVFV